VLREIDLHIRVGEVVALVGMSGGGKSTLADLIPRFYDPTREDRDRRPRLRDPRSQAPRPHRVVTQFTFLFNDSVRATLVRRSAPVDDESSRRHGANAHDSSSSWPRGYDTHIGDLGVRLSGGQNDSGLAIARALLKNAPILILDEATSALDTEAEASSRRRSSG